MKLAHINLVARNADMLASFYINVLGCELLRAPTILTGEKVSCGNGLENSEIRSIWLKLPNLDAPFLEIHQHTVMHQREQPKVNEPGYGHLSFQLNDVGEILTKIIEAGGSQIGQITNFGTSDKPYFIAYARDPEGNVLEFEQTLAKEL